MPVLTVIAGPNGSGKSTLTAMLQAEGVEFGDYLNADDIAREFGAVNEFISRKAQQIVRDRRNAALADGLDHAFETVMSHPSHIDYMLEAKRRGFEVRLHFVATEDPVINLDRVTNRVKHGGHSVPEERIIPRYYRCLGNLPAAVRAASVSVIYDNSSAIEPLRRLARVKAGKMLFHDRALGELTDDIIFTVNNPIKVDRLPVWWLEILLDLKTDNPLTDGPIA